MGKDEATLYQKSVFCPIPAGDTESSKRLFCVILAGCIPVIVNKHLQLPFMDMIAWDEFSVRLPDELVLRGELLPALRTAAKNRSSLRKMQASLGKIRRYV